MSASERASGGHLRPDTSEDLKSRQTGYRAREVTGSRDWGLGVELRVKGTSRDTCVAFTPGDHRYGHRRRFFMAEPGCVAGIGRNTSYYYYCKNVRIKLNLRHIQNMPHSFVSQ